MGSQGSEALTLEAFLALCEAAPEGVRYEAVEGQAVMMSGPSHAHQFALVELALRVRAAVPDDLVVLVSPLDWVLWEVPSLTVRQPDLVVITADQYGRQPLTSPPLLVVELLSPTTRVVDLRDKRREYARAGAEHYWVADLDRPAVEAMRLTAAGTYRVTDRAEGDQALELTAPFPVSVVPSDLRRGPRA
jgi:Uma2 family endonuclease